MEQRSLGNSGIKVSAVGLGCNNFGRRVHDIAAVRAVVHKALDLGVTLLDTADIYGENGKSEEMLGEVLGPRRKDIVIATKFGYFGGASRQTIMRAAEGSLKRLRTETIDLYQMHKPDPKTPIEETLAALGDLMKQGKVRAIGCSNISAAQMKAARTAAGDGPRFVTDQDEYSLLARDIERDALPEVERQGISFLPYFPLASGLLTGKYKRGAALPKGTRLASGSHHGSVLNEHNWALVDKLQAAGKRGGHSLLELAFGWLLAKPVIGSVIAGATRPEQIEQNVAAAARRPSAAAVAEIDAITAR